MISQNEVLDELQEIADVIRALAALIDCGTEVSVDEVVSWIDEGSVLHKINEFAENNNIKTIDPKVKLVEVLRASKLSSDNHNDYNVSKNGFCYLIAKLSECIIMELYYYKNGNMDF